MNKITIFIITLITIQSLQIKARANQCLQKITTAIENNTKNSPAVGLLVIKDGKTIYKKANGLAEIENQIKATNQTPMSLCSMTKQFTAAAILKLQEDGKLNINDNINKYIDWLPEYAKNIKISNLIFHNSGISDYNNDNRSLKNISPEEGLKVRLVIDNEFIKNYIMATKPKFNAGEKYSYSNSGYWLLARIIEKASGKSYSEYINDIIFKKIEAKNSYVNFNTSGVLEAQPYQTWPLYEKLPNMFSKVAIGADGEGGIFMSLDDFEKYIHKVFLGGKIFNNKKTYQKFMSKEFEESKGKYYGFGLKHNETTKYKKIYHDGGTYGYRSNISYYPEKNLVVAMFFGTETFAISALPEKIVRCF